MDELARELAGAVERAEEEGRRSRFLGEIAGSIDLDEVLARTLEAARARCPGVDAALDPAREPSEGEPIVATLGLSADEAERAGDRRPARRAPRRARSRSSYRYADERRSRASARSTAGSRCRSRTSGGRLGYLTVFTRDAGAALRRGGRAPARGARRCAPGPAIENARRFREARQLADLDALTGLHNRRYFHETLAREVRARPPLRAAGSR